MSEETGQFVMKQYFSLTSEGLESPGWVLRNGASIVGICTTFPMGGGVLHRHAHVRGKVYPREYEIPADFAKHLICVEGVGFPNSPELKPEHSFGYVIAAHGDALWRAVLVEDWVEVGIRLDLTWQAERMLLEPNTAFDLMYADLRLNGALGGRPCDRGLILICSPENRPEVLKCLAKYVGQEKVHVVA